MEIKSIIGKHSEIIEDAFTLRHQVFIQEQGFDESVEIDEYDEQALHVVGYLDKRPVAVARMLFKPNRVGKIGRVAILKPYRKLGFGKLLMHYFIDYAKQNNLSSLCLSSQFHAKDFYAKLGFVSEGDIYLEEGAEHILMYYHLA